VNGNDRYAWPPNNKDFAPRAGIAYKITDRLVARIGAGIFYLPPSAMISFDTPGQFIGFSSSTAYNGTTQNGYVPLNLVSNPFANGLTQPTGSSQGLLTLVGDGQSQIWPKAPHPTPYSEEWSFDLQYQLSSHSFLQIGYTGNKGRKLLYGNPNINANQLPDQFLSLQSQLDRQVPNPFYGVMQTGNISANPTIKAAQLLLPYPQFDDVVAVLVGDKDRTWTVRFAGEPPGLLSVLRTPVLACDALDARHDDPQPIARPPPAAPS